MSGPLVIVASIVANKDHRDAVGKALRIAAMAVRYETGCERYELHRDLAHPDTFVMLEQWRDVATADAHALSTAFIALTKALDGKATLHVTKLARID